MTKGKNKLQLVKLLSEFLQDLSSGRYCSMYTLFIYLYLPKVHMIIPRVLVKQTLIRGLEYIMSSKQILIHFLSS